MAGLIALYRASETILGQNFMQSWGRYSRFPTIALGNRQARAWLSNFLTICPIRVKLNSV